MRLTWYARFAAAATSLRVLLERGEVGRRRLGIARSGVCRMPRRVPREPLERLGLLLDGDRRGRRRLVDLKGGWLDEGDGCTSGAARSSISSGLQAWRGRLVAVGKPPGLVPSKSPSPSRPMKCAQKRFATPRILFSVCALVRPPRRLAISAAIYFEIDFMAVPTRALLTLRRYIHREWLQHLLAAASHGSR